MIGRSTVSKSKNKVQKAKKKQPKSVINDVNKMPSESTMKLLKRNRRFIIKEVYNENYNFFNDDGEPEYLEVRYLSSLPDGPHAPNKKEAKLLHRLCSQTGLSLSEIRQNRVYLTMFAKASVKL